MIYFGYFSFSLIHLELKRQVRLYALLVPLKTMPDFRHHNGPNLHLFSDQNGSKTIPFGAAHTYIADIGEYPPVTALLVDDKQQQRKVALTLGFHPETRKCHTTIYGIILIATLKLLLAC